MSRVSSTKLDLQNKSEALENITQTLTKKEEEKVILKQEFEKLSQDAKKQHKELSDRIQAAGSELKAVEAQKAALMAELSTVKEELAQASDSLKNSKSEFEKENQKGKAAILDLVSGLRLLPYAEIIKMPAGVCSAVGGLFPSISLSKTINHL